MRQSDYAQRVLAALADAGYTLRMQFTNNLSDKPVAVMVAAALDEMNATDGSTIYVERDSETGWLHFVWQGPDVDLDDADDTCEVLSDYTTNLEDIIASVDMTKPMTKYHGIADAKPGDIVEGNDEQYVRGIVVTPTAEDMLLVWWFDTRECGQVHWARVVLVKAIN